MRKTTYFACSVLLWLLWAATAFGQMGSPVTIHGFGGWAYGRTDNENRYLAGTQDGAYDEAGFSLNLTAKPYESLTLHVQTSYEEDRDERIAGLDYAFADWSFTDALSLRVGKVKAPFMLATEVYDVGTIRPFFFLPQGVYQEFAAEAYKGVGITGAFIFNKGWELMYDLYGGKLDLQPSTLMNLQTGRLETLQIILTDMLGGRILVRTPLDGLAIGLSPYSGAGKFKIDDQYVPDSPFEDRYTLLGTSAEYLSDRWWLRGEYLTEQSSSKIDMRIGYAEAAYALTEHWQIAARYEKVDLNIADTQNSPNTLFEHEETALGLNYWATPNLVFKLSYHSVKGNRFAIPETAQGYLTAYQAGFDETTNLVVLGVQFSF